LISKVNNVIDLLQVKSPKEAENDPGSSTGSGLAYERPPEQEKKEDEEPNRPGLRIVTELEKAGMTEVVKDFYENRPQDPQPSSQLASRYQVDTSKTKGLLLNKKAE